MPIGYEIADYEYRKEFGLSYKQFLNEPLQVYDVNMIIMGLRRQHANRKSEAVSRK